MAGGNRVGDPGATPGPFHAITEPKTATEGPFGPEAVARVLNGDTGAVIVVRVTKPTPRAGSQHFEGRIAFGGLNASSHFGIAISEGPEGPELRVTGLSEFNGTLYALLCALNEAVGQHPLQLRKAVASSGVLQERDGASVGATGAD